MRSQSESSVFSTQLGCNWTGNGDALGFVVKSDFETHVQGVSADTSYPTRIGPTIQSNITYPCRPQLHDRILIQEGAAPRAYTNALGLLMRDMNLDHTLVMLGMGHDRQEGKIVLEDNGNGVVEWPVYCIATIARRFAWSSVASPTGTAVITSICGSSAIE